MYIYENIKENYYSLHSQSPRILIFPWKKKKKRTTRTGPIEIVTSLVMYVHTHPGTAFYRLPRQPRLSVASFGQLSSYFPFKLHLHVHFSL